MTIDDIEEIRLDLTVNGEQALSMTIQRDGTLGRQGSGSIPMTQPAVLGMTDGRYFREVIGLVEDRVMAHAGVYDLPDQAGLPVQYTIAFLGAPTDAPAARQVQGFRVSLGTETKQTSPVVSFVDAFMSKAAGCTDPWYQAAMEGKRGPDCPGGL